MSAGSDCPDDLALEAYVDGEGPDQRAKIDAHLVGCAACRARVEQLIQLNGLVREVERCTTAPSSLTKRMRSTPEPQASGLSRRAILAGSAALAASVAGVAVVSLSGRDETGLLHPALFGDFRTMVDAGRPVDFKTTDTAEVTRWFKDRIAFMMPDLAALADLGVRGGRLCWLINRRFAAVDFGDAGASCCLYLCEAARVRVTGSIAMPMTGESPVTVSDDRVAGAFWQSGGTAFSLVGDLSSQRLITIANIFRKTGPTGAKS